MTQRSLRFTRERPNNEWGHRSDNGAIGKRLGALRFSTHRLCRPLSHLPRLYHRGRTPLPNPRRVSLSQKLLHVSNLHTCSSLTVFSRPLFFGITHPTLPLGYLFLSPIALVTLLYNTQVTTGFSALIAMCSNAAGLAGLNLG